VIYSDEYSDDTVMSTAISAVMSTVIYSDEYSDQQLLDALLRT
jgi:hypothetical protein